VTVAFDNTFLTLLLNPAASVRPHPITGAITGHMEGRINSLIDSLTTRKELLVLPAPAIAEVMCMVRPAASVLEKIGAHQCIEPYPFDQKCAVTLADFAQQHGPEMKKMRDKNEWARQRVKVDLQIVAVAVTYGADTLYTDDDSQTAFAELCGLKVLHTWDLPLDDKYRQIDLFDSMENDGLSNL
jgi:predicted nucleic acid-binding protein